MEFPMRNSWLFLGKLDEHCLHYQWIVAKKRQALKPIARALDVLQADKTTIAEAVDVWKTLLQKCPGAFKEHVVKRMNDALSPPVLAAYLLDHRFQGKVLTPTETQEALDYIKLMNADAMPHVMQFLAQEPPFSKHLFDSELAKAAPVSWWKTGVRLGFPESIVNLAVAIVGGASSSGGLERHFSSLGFSYGTLRAQLGIEKAGKLAFLYRELNQWQMACTIETYWHLLLWYIPLRWLTDLIHSFKMIFVVVIYTLR